jgi:hypothetical protein
VNDQAGRVVQEPLALRAAPRKANNLGSDTAVFASVHEDGRDVRVLDESELGVFRVVLLAVDCGFDAFCLLVVEDEKVEHRYS